MRGRGGGFGGRGIFRRGYGMGFGRGFGFFGQGMGLGMRWRRTAWTGTPYARGGAGYSTPCGYPYGAYRFSYPYYDYGMGYPDG